MHGHEICRKRVKKNLPKRRNKLFFLDGESKVGIGEGLVAKREVPPFGIESLETVGEHCLAKDHAMLELLGCDAATFGRLAVIACIFTRFGITAEVWVTLGSEPIEGAAHIEFFLGVHIEEGQVDS